MLASFAAWFLVVAYLATALFQIAIVLGAPLGEYSYGGRTVGKLPSRYRISSFFSVVLMLAIAGHYLAFLGVFQPLIGSGLFSIANWVLVGFAALAALLNNITRSAKEKRLWGGVTLAMLLASIIVALA
jgi:hypothetical protein